MQKPLKLMIVAGEASGDSHAADLVRRIRAIEPNTLFFGLAGPRMREVGVEPVVEADALSIVGIGAVARSIPKFLVVFNRLNNEARQQKPDAVILVDFPEFNLKLARSLKKQGLRVIYYISPQIWAWRKYRIRTIRHYVDLLVSIVPFEKEWYGSQGVHHVVQVMNPLIEKVRSSIPGSEFCVKHGLRPEDPIVALLPGSRRKEVSRNLPEMLAAAFLLERSDPGIQFVAALAPSISIDEVESVVRIAVSKPSRLTYVQNETYDLLNASAVAAVTSGTATLEAGILGVPMAVVYKVPIIDYKVLKPLIDVPHIGLVNLVAGERVAKELIQDEFTGKTLSEELMRLLDPNVNSAVREKLRGVSDKLRHDGDSADPGQVIVEFIRSNE